MVAGHLQEKNGLYYIVLSYNDITNKRKTKWIPTGLCIKGNKKRAEKLLYEARISFVCEKPLEEDMYFVDYLHQWLGIVKSNVSLITYASYLDLSKSIIMPYFQSLHVTLKSMKPSDIQNFYTEQLKRVNANTVIHYHAILHRALKYAVKIDLIAQNPADKIDRPKKEPYVAHFYDSTEMNLLFDASKNTKLSLIILLAAFYGLRRSEILGLKWEAIDFDNHTITIRHTLTSCNLDGKHVIIASDRTKTKASMRTLPLVDEFHQKLYDLLQSQKSNRLMCGRSYNQDYDGYVFVDQMGNIIKPNYVTDCFSRILRDHHLRKIRFHDLRHSCASLLLSNGVPMKQIQEWLGHSDFSTTANIYAHLDYQSKVLSANALLAGLEMKNST